MVDRIIKFFRRIREYVTNLFSNGPDPFLLRLVDQAKLGTEASAALVDYMGKPNKKNAMRVQELEREADEIQRILIDEINRTFVTPIDREDIARLARAIDDIIDDTWFTINEMYVLSVSPNDYLKQMAQMLAQGAESIKLAIERLEDHPGVANTHANEAKSIDNDLQELYTNALADLYHKTKKVEDLVEVLKLREIYRHIFHAANRINDAGNTINDIIVKFF